MWASKKENKIKNSFKIRARSADWWRRTAHGMEETSPDTKGTLFCPYDRVSQILRPHRLTARGQRPRPGSMYWGRAGRPIRFRSANGCCTVLLLLLLSHTHTWCVLVHINFLRKVGIDLCSAISDPSSSFPANPHRMHLHSISAYCGRPPSIKGPPWISLPPPHPAQSALRFGSPPLFLPKELSFHDHHVEHSTVDSSRPFYSS